jgi:regulator of PEP synthase PpsR (kinase-PPPase family)|tara:strand:- start:382 stop:528 length:147 start_codon:yes stop_codon:yes gene_type:complete
MKNLLVTHIINQRLMELSNKQGVKLVDFLDALTEKLHAEMKRTGQKPL